MSGKSRMSSWMSPNLWPQIPSSVLRNSGRRAPLLSSLSPQLRWRQEPPPQRFQPQKKQGPQQLPGCWHDRLKWTLKNMELYFFQCFVYMYIYIYFFRLLLLLILCCCCCFLCCLEKKLHFRYCWFRRVPCPLHRGFHRKPPEVPFQLQPNRLKDPRFHFLARLPTNKTLKTSEGRNVFLRKDTVYINDMDTTNRYYNSI